MGENKTDQQAGTSNEADLQQTYGSQQEGRHNREGASPRTHDSLEQEINNPSIKQQDRLDPQDLGRSDNKDDSYDNQKEDEQFDQDLFSKRSQMNEMSEDNWSDRVEGDDKDILGETENSRRNQQYSNGKTRQENTQKR